MVGVILQVVAVSGVLFGLNYALRKSLSEDTRKLNINTEEDLCQPEEAPLGEYRVRNHYH